MDSLKSQLEKANARLDDLQAQVLFMLQILCTMFINHRSMCHFIEILYNFFTTQHAISGDEQECNREAAFPGEVSGS